VLRLAGDPGERTQLPQNSMRSSGTGHAGGPGRVGVRMLLHDEGNGDKAVTSAAAIFDIVS
jgi:hypothetical protein